MKHDDVKKIGIVLSGGLARGAAQLAFVNEIVKKIGYERIAILSSSSIGSINAYAVSCHTIENMLHEYETKDFDSANALTAFVRNGLYNDIFSKIESDTMYIPTYATGTRLINWNTYYFYLNNMSRAEIKNTISLSMSFPIINGPTRSKKGMLFLDGGATDNVPIYPLIYEKLDMIIILHCFSHYRPPLDLIDKDTAWIDVDTTLSLPENVTSFSLSKEAFKLMIETGKKDGKEFADYIFEDFCKANIKKRCHKYTKDHIEERLNKKKDNLMKLVDFLNCLYEIKGYQK